MNEVNLPKNERGIVAAFCFCGSTLALTILYSVLKYNVFEGVAFQNLPLFVMNKAISWSAVFLFSAAWGCGPALRVIGKKASPSSQLFRKWTGIFGVLLLLAHLVISFTILNPSYFKKLFETVTLVDTKMVFSKLNLKGELSILMGVLAFIGFFVLGITSITGVRKSMIPGMWNKIHRLGLWVSVPLFLHLYIMGGNKWLAPEEWTAWYLPPITLLAAFGLFFSFGLRALAYLKDLYTEGFTHRKYAIQLNFKRAVSTTLIVTCLVLLLKWV